MRPVLPGKDKVHHPFGNAEPRPDRLLSKRPAKASDLCNMCICEFRRWVLFPQFAFAVAPSSALSSHIAHVVLMGSKPKVIGVHAAWVITGVAHQHPVWDSSLVQLIRKAVRRHELTVEADAPVSVTAKTSPLPAPVLFRPSKALKSGSAKATSGAKSTAPSPHFAFPCSEGAAAALARPSKHRKNANRIVLFPQVNDDRTWNENDAKQRALRITTPPPASGHSPPNG